MANPFDEMMKALSGKKSGPALNKKYPAKDTVTVRVGNYAAPVDTAGMDPEMKRTMSGKPDSTRVKPLRKGVSLSEIGKGIHDWARKMRNPNF